ncbi:phage antirepressor KilAC domain-containing protein [Pseudomonas sp. DCB_CB]|uniref:phage antirepressor KilAC domain-containing protein n=1 Tax=unclassified Pseudomonas TaxID=196821 RepID=UPI0022491DBD|nr:MULTISPECIES: phage antirepressor KilAC domain-containing protein [unclassified Pseudomonas]MCX2694296.1 phage antirepressor KilAC domain-containing protein [Pseudomonas sp. DCB_BZ]MCX2859427.1 phage antirepressor KilAC domain-containing protein [Pseudomonas sp. DCB_CB]
MHQTIQSNTVALAPQNANHDFVARTVTMSSSEIAELTGKLHKNVIRDIRDMLDALKDDGSDLSHVREEKDSRGYTSEFYLDRELTETLLTGYSVPLRRKVIHRLHELEQHASPRVIATLPDFSNPAAAARAWAEQYEQRQIAQQALAIAAPKVEFVDRYVEASGLKGFRQTAKLLKANEARFREFLLDKKIMYRMGGEWQAYQQHIDAGRFSVKTGTSDSGHAFNQAKFTPKGVTWVAGLWAQHNLGGI